MSSKTWIITITTEHPPAIEELETYLNESVTSVQGIYLDTIVSMKET